MVATPPPVHRSAAAQAALEKALTDGFAAVPFHHLLGLEVIRQTPNSSQIRVKMRPDLMGNVLHRRLHGGVTATILDAAGGFSICVAMAEKFCDEDMEQLSHRFARIGTIDMRIDYLHQAQGATFIATGTVLRLGGRIASTHMSLANEQGDIVATGAAAYIVS